METIKKSISVYLSDWQALSRWAIEAQTSIAVVIMHLVAEERERRAAGERGEAG